MPRPKIQAIYLAPIAPHAGDGSLEIQASDTVWISYYDLGRTSGVVVENHSIHEYTFYPMDRVYAIDFDENAWEMRDA